MKRTINLVLVGALTVLSIILALPFTPLRSSFNGIANNVSQQIITGLGVDLNGKIKNARLIANAHEYDVADFGVNQLDGYSKNFKSGAYSDMNGLISDGNYGAFDLSQGGNKSKGGGGNESMSAFSGNAGRKTSSGTGGGGGFVSINTKSNTTIKPGGITKQSGNAENNGTGGGTHPGVDPLGSLPLGDGFSILFILAFGYIGYKKAFVY